MVAAANKTDRANLFTVFKTLENNCEKKLNLQLQPGCIATKNFKKSEEILQGPHSGVSCQIMDIFVSGYEKLGTDSYIFFLS